MIRMLAQTNMELLCEKHVVFISSVLYTPYHTRTANREIHNIIERLPLSTTFAKKP